jgi:hypothetical protein
MTDRGRGAELAELISGTAVGAKAEDKSNRQTGETTLERGASQRAASMRREPGAIFMRTAQSV